MPQTSFCSGLSKGRSTAVSSFKHPPTRRSVRSASSTAPASIYRPSTPASSLRRSTAGPPNPPQLLRKARSSSASTLTSATASSVTSGTHGSASGRRARPPTGVRANSAIMIGSTALTGTPQSYSTTSASIRRNASQILGPSSDSIRSAQYLVRFFPFVYSLIIHDNAQYIGTRPRGQYTSSSVSSVSSLSRTTASSGRRNERARTPVRFFPFVYFLIIHNNAQVPRAAWETEGIACRRRH
jgi:hypothetical protein